MMSKGLCSAVLALAMASVAVGARAVEVTLQLDRAATRTCRPDLGCTGFVPATVLPAGPRGTRSSIDVDGAGQPIRAVLDLEGYALDGTAVAPWSGLLERLDSGGYGVADPNHPWPVNLPGQLSPGKWSLQITRFTSQTDFAGELHLGLTARTIPGPYHEWRLDFSFASIPGAAPPPCEGETLLLDDDGDGKINSRDLATVLEPEFGAGVDELGQDIAVFCSRGAWACNRLDFRNDEPLLRKPGDCHLSGEGRRRLCAPGAIFEDPAPVVSGHVCEGYSVIDDSDGDGEPDSTDRCASTPADAFVDGKGCSIQEFCSQQTQLACVRADFQNDEPTAKNPHDCARAASEPLACTAATPR